MLFQHISKLALEDNLTSLSTCLRPHINYVIGILHHLLVMFDHNNRIARITQLLQRVYKLDIILLVQTDTRFVKNIQHIYQLATNLCCQTDTLTLATRKTYGSAV